MSTALRIDVRDRGLERAAAAFNQLSTADTQELFESVAALGVSQTQRRISEEKESPEGEAWPKWSARYAKTRQAGQSLLQASGALLESITDNASNDYAEWGSNLVQAALLNFGGTDDMPAGPAAVPAREFLGLSTENTTDMQATIDDWLDELLPRGTV